MDDLPVTRNITIPAWELVVQTMRASGPGGQGVNKTDSKVELRWNIEHTSVLNDTQRARVRRALRSRLTLEGDLIVRAADERSQHRNRTLARERLAGLVRDALQPPKPRRSRSTPTRNQKRKRLESKKQLSDKKRLRKKPEW